MKVWDVEVEGDAREVYTVEAESAEEAAQKFRDGLAGEPTVAEMQGAEVTAVAEVMADA